MILNVVDKQCQYSTCFSSMGGVSVVDYLMGDPNSLRSLISDFSIGNKQPDSNHCLFFITISNGVGSRSPTSSNQGQVLGRQANMFSISNMNSLNIYARRDLHLIRHSCSSPVTLDSMHANQPTCGFVRAMKKLYKHSDMYCYMCGECLLEIGWWTMTPICKDTRLCHFLLL